MNAALAHVTHPQVEASARMRFAAAIRNMLPHASPATIERYHDVLAGFDADWSQVLTRSYSFEAVAAENLATAGYLQRRIIDGRVMYRRAGL